MRCLWVEPDGTHREVHTEHDQAYTLFRGASLTMLGGLDELKVFAVGLREPSADAAVHQLCTDGTRFDVPVRGPVLFVGTDAAGEPMDVDVEGVMWVLGHKGAVAHPSE